MTRSHRYLFTALTVLLATVCTAAVPLSKKKRPDRAPLAYAIAENQTLSYRAEFYQNITAEFNSESNDFGATTKGLVHLTGLHSGAEDTLKISILIDSLKAVPAGSMAMQTIDTGGAEGIPFTMTMRPDGTITGFNGADTLRTGLGFNGPGRILASHFFDYYAGNFFPALPAQPLKKGITVSVDTAYIKDVRPVIMHFNVENVYILEDRETVLGIDCLRIRLDTIGTIDTPDETNPVSLEGDMEAETLFWFDAAKGRIVKCSYNCFMEVAMSQAERGVISYAIENTIEYDLIK